MIIGLLVLITVMEVIRFWIYIQDSRRVNETNRLAAEQHKKMREFAERQNDEWKQIRKAEIKELRQLAKESDTMKQIYDEWVKEHIGK